MNFLKRWMLPLALILGGCLVAAGPASAQKNKTPARKVDDAAGLFSDAARQQANADIAEIKRKHNKDLYIETFEKAPAKYKSQKAEDFREKWAAEVFAQREVNGVLVIICEHPHLLHVQVGDKTRNEGLFTANNATELRKLMLKRIQEAANAKDKGEEKKAKAKWDEALTEGTAYVKTTMNEHHRTTAAGGGGGATVENSILGWICLALVVVFVIWIVFAIIRALTAPRYGPGYGGGGPGYGGGYGGGGGGGFFPSLLGGLFGAAAGMWLYSNMFGGHAYGGQYNSGGGGGDYGGGGGQGSSDVGAGSTGTGGEWTGGDQGGDRGDKDFGDKDGGDRGDKDFGDKDGGDGGDKGDWGGGGGDFGGGTGGDGGGGDGGGGGDWGGGGGDFGGGGGGDFGGGGGGGGDW